MKELIEEFEATKPYPAWINADIYPDGKIYTKEFTEWLAQKVTDLRPNQSTECAMHDVVGRSEQLKAFREWTRENLNEEDIVTQQAVDRYLESL